MQSGASHASDLVMTVRTSIVRVFGHLKRSYRLLPHPIIDISPHLTHHLSGSTCGVVDPVSVEIFEVEDEGVEVDEGAAYFRRRSLRLCAGEAAIIILRAIADFTDERIDDENRAVAVV